MTIWLVPEIFLRCWQLRSPVTLSLLSLDSVRPAMTNFYTENLIKTKVKLSHQDGGGCEALLRLTRDICGLCVGCVDTQSLSEWIYLQHNEDLTPTDNDSVETGLLMECFQQFDTLAVAHWWCLPRNILSLQLHQSILCILLDIIMTVTVLLLSLEYFLKSFDSTIRVTLGGGAMKYYS